MRTESNGFNQRTVLTDTGPLVALINANDPYHSQAVAGLAKLLHVPLLTTWPCTTEAMYLLNQAGGYPAQENLWEMMARGAVSIHSLTESDWQRMRTLMATYRDAPMDLADASLVATAEAVSARRIFTFDRHFHAYRLLDGNVLEVVP